MEVIGALLFLLVVIAPIAWAVHKRKIELKQYRITPWILEKLNMNVKQLAIYSAGLCATGLLMMLTVMYHGGTESTQAPYVNYVIYALYLIGGAGLMLAVIHEAHVDAGEIDRYTNQPMDEHDPFYGAEVHELDMHFPHDYKDD